MDLNHGPLHHPDADLPVIILNVKCRYCRLTAGAAQSRVNEVDLVENTKIFKSIITEVMENGFKGIFMLQPIPTFCLCHKFSDSKRAYHRFRNNIRYRPAPVSIR